MKTETSGRRAPSRAAQVRAAIARQARVIAAMNARPTPGAVPYRSPIARAVHVGDALTREELMSRLGVLAGLAQRGAR